MKHLIVDLETLDTTASSCITAVSFIMFDPSEFKGLDELVSSSLSIKLNWLDQMDMGRTVSDDTVEFWKLPENQEAFKVCVEPKDTDVSIKELPRLLQEFIEANSFDPDTSLVYSRGNVFDLGILENLFIQLNFDNPLPFWAYRDVRTEVDSIMQHLDPNHKNNGYIDGFNVDGLVKHNSAHDCAYDIMTMQMAHYKLAMALQGE